MATYKPLQSIQLTTTSSSLTFSGIDQNYTDLVFVANYTKSTNASLRISVNGDTGTNYSQTIMYGDGSTPLGQRETNVSYFYCMDYVSSTSTVPNQTTVHFQNYSNTTTYKTFLDRSGNAANGTVLSGGLWRSTVAITSFTVSLSSGTFSAGTTFDLYGIKAGTPKAVGGDSIFTDGTYWYHVFKSSGMFSAQGSTLSVDALVVAGGGGAGGGNVCGGAGAGGYRTISGLSFPGQTAVLVGAGGTGVADNVSGRSSGSNSSFSSITSTGGGTSSTSGGSGGGGNRDGSSSGAAGNAGGYSPVEGYAGGTSPSGSWIGAAGGGGAGGVGVGGTGGSMTSEKGGAGGIGAYTAISGGSTTGAGVLSGGNYYFAGGGGGGTEGGARNGASLGGTGGGGNGSEGTVTAATSGTANTGGGAGGAGYDSGKGGNGGSGIVIVRYPV